jgi:hypothetical protein
MISRSYNLFLKFEKKLHVCKSHYIASQCPMVLSILECCEDFYYRLATPPHVGTPKRCQTLAKTQQKND